ncbi:MAG: response regulator [Verrucomicrobiae bacterium]|nr:response regulator [Verrucomicrobiae bacterium]
MNPLIQSQTDYFLFAGGLGWILFAVICRQLSHTPAIRQPGIRWKWLAISSLLHGLAICLFLLDPPAASLAGRIQTCLAAAGYFSLLIFGWRNLRPDASPSIYNYSAWLGILPLAAGMIGGWPYFGLFSRSLIGTTGAILSALCLWRNTSPHPKVQPLVRLAGILFGLWAFLLLLPASLDFTRLLHRPAPLPALIEALGAWLLCFFLWRALHIILFTEIEDDTGILPPNRIMVWVQWGLPITIVAGGLGVHMLENLGSQIDRQLTGSLAIFSRNVLQQNLSTAGEVARAASLSPAIISHLQHPQPASQKEAVHAVERYSLVIPHSIVYVMAPKGNVLLSSNHQEPDSFAGKNYSDRPYFMSADAGQPGSFFGAGLTSREPGYYASNPIFNPNGSQIGIVTVKIRLPKQNFLPQSAEHYYLASPEGVVLLSNHATHQYRPLWPLDAAICHELVEKKQFNRINPSPIFPTRINFETPFPVDEHHWVASASQITPEGWQIIVMAPSLARNFCTLAGMGIILLLIAIQTGILLVLLRTNQAGGLLAISEKRYRQMFTEHSAVMILLDPVTKRIVDSNQAAVNFYGLSRPHLLQSKITDIGLLPPEQTEKAIQQALAKKQNLFHSQHRAAGGQIRDVELRCVPLVIGRETLLHSVIHDITELKQLERRLELQRDLAIALTQETSLDKALALCLETAIAASGMDCGGIYLLDEDGGKLRLAKHKGISAEFTHLAAAFDIKSDFGKSVTSSHILYDIHPRSSDHARGLLREKILTTNAVPIINHGASIGCFTLGSHQIDKTPKSSRPILTAIASQAGHIIVRLKQQQHIDSNHRELESLFNSIRDIIIVTDQEGRILHLNPSGLTQLGIKKDQLPAMRLPDLYSDEHRDRVEHLWKQIIHGHASDITLPFRTANGESLFVETKFTPGFWENRLVLFGLARDISERLAMERILEESEAYIRNIFTSLDVGLMVVDAETHEIVDINPRAAAMASIDRAALIGSKCHRLVCPAQKGPILKSVIPITLDGRKRLIETFVDITDRKKLEASLLKAKEAAEAADRAKSEFLAVMSHEIRTPLNSIIGFTSLLCESPMGGEQHGFAEIIRSNANELLSLINDILDFSKIEAGRIELDHHPFDPCRCAEEILEMLAPRAADKDLALLFFPAAPIPARVLGDATRLKQILTNLIGNAVKFTHQGEVEISLSSKPAPDGKWMITFDIRDTGIGIPGEKMDRLFKPFSQVDTSTTRNYGGSGLGLVISQRLCHLMGGHITVSSVVNHGSTFSFTVTVENAGAATDASCLPQPVGMEKQRLLNRRILVADHHPRQSEIIVSILKTWGCDAFSAANLRQTVEFVKNQSPVDVIIADICLDDMPFMEFGSQIQLVGKKVKPLLFLISPFNRSSEAGPLLQLGFSACLAKPLRFSNLYETLLRYFASSSPGENSKTPVPDANSSPLQPKQRILIAEDNLSNQKLVACALEIDGHECHVVADGLELLEALRRKTYDLVLLDIQMPNLDGISAARQIRAGECGSKASVIPLIALSACATPDDRSRCMAAGINHFLTKPLDLQQLRQVILSESRAAQSA